MSGLSSTIDYIRLMADMSGPQHYERAEELLKKAGQAWPERTEGERARMLAEAQVHATLALVAATVFSGATSEEHLKRWGIKGVSMRLM